MQALIANQIDPISLIFAEDGPLGYLSCAPGEVPPPPPPSPSPPPLGVFLTLQISDDDDGKHEESLPKNFYKITCFLQDVLIMQRV